MSTSAAPDVELTRGQVGPTGLPQRQIPVLAAKTLRDHWRGLLGWGIGLFALCVVQLSVYPSVKETAAATSALMDALPEAVREMFRMSDYTSGPGYLSAELFSIMMPLAFIGIGIAWGSGATAGEEDRGTADLLLSLPLRRRTVIWAKALAMVLALAALATLVWLVLLIGRDIVNLDVSAAGLAAVCFAMLGLGVLYGGLGMFVGALTGRRGAATGVSVVAAITAFVIFSLEPIVDAFHRWLPLMPFQWAQGPDPIRNGVHWGYMTLMIGMAAVFITACAAVFERRDIGT